MTLDVAIGDIKNLAWRFMQIEWRKQKFWFEEKTALMKNLTCGHKESFCNWIKDKGGYTLVLHTAINNLISFRGRWQEKEIMVLAGRWNLVRRRFSVAEDFRGKSLEFEVQLDLLICLLSSNVVGHEDHQLQCIGGEMFIKIMQLFVAFHKSSKFAKQISHLFALGFISFIPVFFFLLKIPASSLVFILLAPHEKSRLTLRSKLCLCLI